MLRWFVAAVNDVKLLIHNHPHIIHRPPSLNTALLPYWNGEIDARIGLALPSYALLALLALLALMVLIVDY